MEGVPNSYKQTKLGRKTTELLQRTQPPAIYGNRLRTSLRRTQPPAIYGNQLRTLQPNLTRFTERRPGGGSRRVEILFSHFENHAVGRG